MTRSSPMAAAHPADVDWQEAIENAAVPGTVASTLSGSDQPDGRTDINYDDHDWWYRCNFSQDTGAYRRIVIELEGLATIAEVWLNGEPILSARNMFRSYRVDISSKVQADNVLDIVFRSSNHDLSIKRPRPRWKTKLVANQQLRWLRTTLLGRIPGWTPPIQPAGPWRPIKLLCGQYFNVDEASVYTCSNAEGDALIVDVALSELNQGIQIEQASIAVLGKHHDLQVQTENGKISVHGNIQLSDIERWHPGHNGTPRLYNFDLTVRTQDDELLLKSGRIGFRSVDVDRSDDRLGFLINGRPMFARGSCWTSNDIVSLTGDPEKLRDTLTLFQRAGGNMLRIGGTMVYESDRLYELCDELGISVWQDFMFANMDYPYDDAEFRLDVSAEIAEQLKRLRQHPCVITYCGNSEVEQQAAMYGMTEAIWRNDLFYKLIPESINSLCPGVAYFPSSPCEGDLPFHNSQGVSHYFGVGAYKQNLEDLKKTQVKFAAECLAFSNFPADETLRDCFDTVAPAVHHPAWKSGVPRDSSTGWDFEDVRDHYLGLLYGLDPVELRYADKERYAAISQVVSGEIMQAAFLYWRSPASSCAGALTWFLNDIVPGAGWGIIDSLGRPKPLYFFLKRCWASVALMIQDNGMDGLSAIIINDSETTLKQRLVVDVLQHSRISIARSECELIVDARQATEQSIDAILGRFLDCTYRHRFGPSKHDVVVVAITDENNEQLQVASYYPHNQSVRPLLDVNLQVETEIEQGKILLRLHSDSFLQHVKLSSRTHQFDDNYFDLAPGLYKTVTATPLPGVDRPMRGSLSALNLATPVNIP